MSDNHNNLSVCVDVMEKYHNKIDLFVHLGDGADNFDDAAQIYSVKHITLRGNCDRGCQPDEIIFEAGNKKFYACHGHNFSVGITKARYWNYITENNFNVGLFGHTHIAYYEECNGRYLINPGSLTKSRKGENSFCIIDADEDNIKTEFFSSDTYDKIFPSYLYNTNP